jgi:hypothetical protein
MYFGLFCWSGFEVGIRLGIIAFFGLFWALPGTVRAHPLLDRAVAAYERAEFEQALRTFHTAERNADLSVDELLQLFEMRALVHDALGDRASMNTDLRRLVAVRGSYQLSKLAPPSVRASFEELRKANSGPRAVEFQIEEKTIEGGSWVVARLLRVPDGLVDHTTLQCNVDNNARTVSRTSEGTSATVKLPESGVHHGCAATARTRQGGVLFSASTEGERVLVPSNSAARFQMPRYQSPGDSGEVRKKKWPWIVAVSAVVVAGGVTAGVLVSKRSKSDSQPQVGAVTVNW